MAEEDKKKENIKLKISGETEEGESSVSSQLVKFLRGKGLEVSWDKEYDNIEFSGNENVEDWTDELNKLNPKVEIVQSKGSNRSIGVIINVIKIIVDQFNLKKKLLPFIKNNKIISSAIALFFAGAITAVVIFSDLEFSINL